MKRCKVITEILFWIIIALATIVWVSRADAQVTTTTITGTIRDLSNATVTSGAFKITLRPSPDTTISGNARFAGQVIDCKITAAGAIKASDGVSACIVTKNTSQMPSGTYYEGKLCPYNSCTSRFNFYAIADTLDISTIVPTPASTPMNSLVDVFSTQSAAGDKTWTGAAVFSKSLYAADASSYTAPVRAVLSASAPASCLAKIELLIKKDATAGQQLFICNSTGNGWVLLGDGGGVLGSGLTLGQLIFGAGGSSIAVGNLTGDATTSGTSAVTLNSKFKTRMLSFIMGSNTGVALADTDDQADVFINRLGTGVHVTEVYCRSDAGTPSINLQRNDGTPANILSANLTCTSTGASSTSFTVGEDAIANQQSINFVMVTAGGTAKRITVVVKYTLD